MTTNNAQVTPLRREATVMTLLLPFFDWIEDPEVTEICVNRPNEVFIEKNSKWERHDCKVTVESLEFLARAVATYANQDVSNKKPLLSASLPDGSRMQFILRPAVEDCPSFTMRKPSKSIRPIEDYTKEGLFENIRRSTTDLALEDHELKGLYDEGKYEEFLRKAVQHRKNIVVAGATGSGKTTFMKSLVNLIPDNERIITIEDVRELFIPQPNAVHLIYSKGGQGVAEVTPKSLLESCLRMKPDRIMLAELRGDECLYYVRNAASGHPGSITSCHAGSPSLAFEQMAIMIQDSQGGANLTFEVIKRLLLLTIDIVVQFKNEAGQRSISEIYYDPEKKIKAMM